MSNKKRSVFICGHFGFRANKIDGQTIKTRVLKDAFVNKLGEFNVRFVDTANFLRSPIQFFYEARKAFKECCQVVMLPGIRGLYMFLPFFLKWKRKWGGSLQYVVIGGWLPKLLGKNVWLRQLCSKIDCIYVETVTMAESLNRLNLSNVKVMPNFRKFDRNSKYEFIPTETPIKLVFYSRISREKGVEDAVTAVQLINSHNTTQPTAILDIYGPVVNGYEKKFQKLLFNSKYVKYYDILSPSKATKVLQTYDLMLFPTYYKGEGFPGALLDAYIAGLPVIASDWKYNSEIVVEGKTGVIFKTHSVDEIVAHVETFIANPERILQMRQNCIKQAQNYHVENVVVQLLSDAKSKC